MLYRFFTPEPISDAFMFVCFFFLPKNQQIGFDQNFSESHIVIIKMLWKQFIWSMWDIFFFCVVQRCSFRAVCTSPGMSLKNFRAENQMETHYGGGTLCRSLVHRLPVVCVCICQDGFAAADVVVLLLQGQEGRKWKENQPKLQKNDYFFDDIDHHKKNSSPFILLLIKKYIFYWIFDKTIKTVCWLKTVITK